MTVLRPHSPSDAETSPERSNTSLSSLEQVSPTHRAACADFQAFHTQQMLENTTTAKIEGRVDGHYSWRDCSVRSKTASEEQQRAALRNGTFICAELFVLRPSLHAFLNHDASSPKSRLATASAGKEDPGRGHDEKSKAGRPGRRRPAMATPETGAGVDCHDV